jgi:N-acetylglucosaminyl-diphospho-decaprenol L-rhamnosyltransferase
MRRAAHRDRRPDSRVAIVIATRNRRELLLRTLALHRGLSERPQIVVVDDGSTDGTAAAVSASAPEVTVIRCPRGRGAAVRNLGLRAIDSPYVALCDDDSWWSPGALRHAADLLDEHRQLAVINARILIGADHHDAPICAELDASPLPAVDGQPGRALLSFLAGAVVVRRRAVLEVGGFCERLGFGGEEELLACDLIGAGWQISYLPEIVAFHDPPPTHGRPRRREEGLRSRLIVTWLRSPAPQAAVRTLHELRRAPRDRHSARGVARAAAALPWVLRERAPSPPNVERMRRLLEQQRRRQTTARDGRDDPGAGTAPMATQEPVPPPAAAGSPTQDAGRNETRLERCDRNLVELLQEVRVVQTSVQVLFAFLLTAALAARFPQLTAFQRAVYFVTLLAAGAASVLLIAPTAHHRILFRRGDKEHLVTVANRFTLAGLAGVAISMLGALLLVTDILFARSVALATTIVAALLCASCWSIAPLARRGRLARESPRPIAAGLRPRRSMIAGK